MRRLIEECRNAIMAAPDTVCTERARLVTEAYEMHADDPAPIRRARAFGHVLRHMALDLDSNPIFAGNTSSRPRAWMLLPEYGFVTPAQAIVENPALAGQLDGDAVPAEIRAFWQDRAVGGAAGIGHLAVDNARLLSGGLGQVIAKAEGMRRERDDEKRVYRQACSIACRAVIEWARRCADAASAAADVAECPVRAAALRRVAEACRHVPARPARNLFEALQSIVLVHLAVHIEGHGYSVSPGRLDQALAPYYRNDADATELIAAFLLKLNANSLWGSHSKTQCITLGGVGEMGGDQCNPLTVHFLEACELARVPDPHIFLRWRRNISTGVKSRAVDMLCAGLSMPMLIGDEQTVAGLVRAGVPPRDARNYCVIGCNELGIAGKLIFNAVSCNGIAVLRDILLDAAAREKATDMASLLEQMELHTVERLRPRIEARAEQMRKLAQTVPTPFTSSLMHGCIERGKDMHEGLTYPFVNVVERGFSNLVNALAAIDAIVFMGTKTTLGELGEAMRANFKPAWSLRRRLLAAPKWGNDKASADRCAVAWLEARERAVRTLSQAPDAPPLLVEMVVRSLHHIEGGQLGATPDGRLAGEPLADSIGPTAGTASAGPTAVLNSVRKLAPSKYWTGGYSLNLTLPAASAAEQGAAERLQSLVEAFFAQGGQELQINCLDPDMLRDAKDHPENYPGLLVRVAGFNARFVDLSPLEQDELVRRAEACGDSE